MRAVTCHTATANIITIDYNHHHGWLQCAIAIVSKLFEIESTRASLIPAILL